MPGVLRAYWTIPGRPTGTTLFAIAYGMEAIIPMEIGMPQLEQLSKVQKNENQELERHLDWADKARGNASIWMAAYQQRAVAHYNRKAGPCVFRIGTLVLKKVFENMVEK